MGSLWTRCSLHVYPNFHWYLASVIKLLKTALTSLFQNENKGFQNGFNSVQHGIDKIISGPDNNTLGPFKKKIPKPLFKQNLTYLPYPPTRPPSLLHYNQTKYSVNFSPFLEIAHCFESCLLTTHTLDDSIRLNRKENSVMRWCNKSTRSKRITYYYSTLEQYKNRKNKMTWTTWNKVHA